MAILITAVVLLVVTLAVAMLSDRRDRRAGRHPRGSGDISRSVWRRRRVTRWREAQVARKIIPPRPQDMDSGDRTD